MNELAAAGGTGTYFGVSDEASIVSALNEIVQRTVSCVLFLNDTGNGTPDAGIITVEQVSGSGAARTRIASDVSNGYTLAGDTITLHGSACNNLKAAVQSDAGAHVEVRQGCACVPAAQEICGNDKDDDCDGRIDEDCTVTSTCELDAPPAQCEPPSQCGLEVCDGKDNDCDMMIDEGCGMCRPFAEICDDKDNDCDGDIDEMCLACEDPSREICDGKDNDCDGDIDEGCGPIVQ
jgi:hypothetical protein